MSGKRIAIVLLVLLAAAIGYAIYRRKKYGYPVTVGNEVYAVPNTPPVNASTSEGSPSGILPNVPSFAARKTTNVLDALKNKVASGEVVSINGEWVKKPW